MSGLDPSAAAIRAAVDAADFEFLETALPIEPAATPAANVSVGDVVPAVVLPPQGGQDFIQFAGSTLPAQLPPDITPGQTLALQVTQIAPNQIVVRNLGAINTAADTAAAQNAVPQNAVLQTTAQTAAPENPPPQTAPTQSASTQAAPPAQTAQTAARTPPVATKFSPAMIAPPREVFVAASVRPAPPVGVTPVRGALDARIAAAQSTKTATVTPPLHARSDAPPAVIARTNAASRFAHDLVRALRLPDTAFVRTVAAIARQAPQRIAPMLQRLDAALQKLPSDPRAATARTIVAFVSRLDLRNGETLPTQIEAYVSHVVRSFEPKIAKALEFLSAAPRTPAHVAAQAKAAVHLQSAQHDLKALVVSMLRDAALPKSPQVAQTLNEAVMTITATQVDTLRAAHDAPNTVQFTLPAFFHERGGPASLRISRDGGASGGPISADHFHVALVLDTANLGTVAIDLQSAARALNVSVKAETQQAAQALGERLPSLRERLERLRYRVASASAGAAQEASHPHVAPGLDARA